MSTKIIQTQLMQWFCENKRRLPWRLKRTPYRTWISEMMLQQTQVQTMLPYFQRWMKALPSIEHLRKASLHDVLALWQGLGYYSRARMIKKAADYLYEYHAGHLPRTYAEIIRVPGIGPYSAGAILSLAFNLSVPIVDGNVLRVISRLRALRDPIDQPKTVEKIRQIEAELIPDANPGIFNEALMELGALICTPREPKCLVCPISKYCQAFKEGLTQSLPVKLRCTKIKKVTACALVMENQGRYLIQQRPEGQVMGGLWEFPEWKLRSGKWTLKRQLNFLAGALNTNYESLVFLRSFKRHYTRYAEDLHVFKSTSETKLPNPEWPKRWLKPKQLKQYPLTSAHSKIRALLSA